MRVIFVCTGNTCRSPIAEGYLNSQKIPLLKAESRGLFADGSSVSDNSAAVMREIGIDISGHISKRLTPDDIAAADKIICLSPSHSAQLAGAGVAGDKLSVLGTGISDPFGGNEDVYRRCRDDITGEIDRLIAQGAFDSIKIVPLEQRHIPAIAKLESICFSEPWSAEGIAESYRNSTKFLVAESSCHVIGYIGINTVLDEGYITNIAVFEKYRGQGVATALLKSTFAIAGEQKLSFISLEVRESNSTAISLYEKNGFRPEGRRKSFYRSPAEDAIIMTKRFEQTDENTCN